MEAYAANPGARSPDEVRSRDSGRGPLRDPTSSGPRTMSQHPSSSYSLPSLDSLFRLQRPTPRQFSDSWLTCGRDTRHMRGRCSSDQSSNTHPPSLGIWGARTPLQQQPVHDKCLLAPNLTPISGPRFSSTSTFEIGLVLQQLGNPWPLPFKRILARWDKPDHGLLSDSRRCVGTMRRRT